MSRTPARVTQADIARALRAARQAGEMRAEARYPDGTVLKIEDIDAVVFEDEAPQDPLKRPEGFVYVVGFAQFIKIGWSLNVNNRIRELQINLPKELKLHSSIHAHPSLERILHKRFAALRTRGEWFRHEGALADWIRTGCQP